MSRSTIIRSLLVVAIVVASTATRTSLRDALPSSGLGPIAAAVGVVLIVAGIVVFALGTIAAHGAQRAGRRVGRRQVGTGVRAERVGKPRYRSPAVGAHLDP